MARTLTLTLVWVAWSVSHAFGGCHPEMLLSGNATDRQTAISVLRGMGPKGLKLALEVHDQLVEKAGQAKLPGAYELVFGVTNQKKTQPEFSSRLELCRRAIDQIAGQRDATVSRIYWCTDLDHALAVSKKIGKPILSLRMLGRLTDEFSCANSRFFRTTLYSNQEISKMLGERFVLHWESVRPVPKVTIDFGDGRKLERTITGNSAHYLLASDGRPLDVLPGLYSPKEFLDWLHGSEKLFLAHAATDSEERSAYLAKYHADRLAASRAQLRDDLQTLDRADMIDRLQESDREIWHSIADLHRGEVKLDKASIRLIRNERPDAFRAGTVAVTKCRVEDPILKAVRTFEDSISLDTVRNEHLLHSQIHRWFAQGEVPAELAALNERVYAELFLTPSSDPWLGLVPESSYTGLERGGLSAVGSR